MTNLNPHQFFHGTASDIAPGEEVLPGKRVGKQHWPSLRAEGGRSSSASAYATSDEGTAWRFATHAARSGEGRARVLEVNPHPEMKPGLFNSLHPKINRREDLHEYVAPSFQVKRSIDIMPGRQGTFPQIDWHQHAGDPSWRPSGDPYNHPSHMDLPEVPNLWKKSLEHGVDMERYSVPPRRLLTDRTIRNLAEEHEPNPHQESLF